MTAKTTTAKTAKAAKRSIFGSARDLAGQVQDVAGKLASQMPDAGNLKDTALDAYHTVETMPKSRRKTVTTWSLVAGALLWVLGAPRLLTIAAFLPAIAIGGTRMARRKSRA